METLKISFEFLEKREIEKDHRSFTDEQQFESDAVAWEAFKAGDLGAFDYVYNKNIQHLFNYGLNINGDEDLVKDCIQELFIYMWKRKANLSTPHSLKAYLFTGLRRKIVQQVLKNNKTKTKKSIPLNYSFELVLPREATLINNEGMNEEKALLMKELNNMPERQREALYLRYFDDLDYQEIALILGVKQQSAYNLIFRGIELLKRKLLMVSLLSGACSFI